MNFLNSDFSTSGESKRPSAQEFRDRYLSTLKRPSSSLLFGEPPPNDPNSDKDFREGKAGLLGTLFWNTLVLAERSARNYLRNLLAYGVRAGMYAGRRLPVFIGFNIYSNRYICRDGFHACVSFAAHVLFHR
jgi:hypothetical protein